MTKLMEASDLRAQLQFWLDRDLSIENLRNLISADGAAEIGRRVVPNFNGDIMIEYRIRVVRPEDENGE